jgi:hypothetical protein
VIRLVLLGCALALGAPQQRQTGVWEANRVNDKPLPMTDQVVGDDGFTHAVRLQGMTIRLRPNGRFVAALSYRRAILSRGERIDQSRLQNDTWMGTYTQQGAALRFVPEKNGDRKVEPFNGTIAGRRITIDFDYDIVKRKRYALALDRNDAIW